MPPDLREAKDAKERERLRIPTLEDMEEVEKALLAFLEAVVRSKRRSVKAAIADAATRA